MGLAELANCEGWHVEEIAARAHYQGEGDQYSIEYYAPNDAVLYWAVQDEQDIAVPVDRETVPDPLRTRIREDLDTADIDPALEGRSL